MNVANSLLNLLSFTSKNKYKKEQLAKMQRISLTGSLTILLILLVAGFSFSSSSMVPFFILFAAAAVLFTFQLLILKNKLHQQLQYAFAITTGLVFSYLLVVSPNPVMAILCFSATPLISTGLLGHRKGSPISIIWGVLLAAFLFIPISLLSQLGELPISIKVTSIAIYFFSYIFITLYATLKQNILNEREKEIIDQKSTIKLKEEFIANLSHQIRTPLNNIMVVANILEDVTADEKQKDMIDTIHASTNNLVNVVNSMVEISNVDIKERGSINLNFNLYSTINSTIKLFSTQNSNQTAFTLKIDESIPSNLIGDPVRVKQIFLNLIESILKNRSSSKANVSIKVNKAKETTDNVLLEIVVSSNKPILLPLNEGHNMFVTNESSLTSASTQMYIDLLELSITQKLIESNGGKLQIALSAEDAIFSFPYTLNKTTSEQPSQATTRPTYSSAESELMQPDSNTPATSVNLEEANVLLVEDNLINQKIVVLSLKKVVKNIEIANNGKEALDKFGTSRFDIILMDIQMPIMNGIVATKKIREIEASSTSHTPIIAITANALLGDKEECLAAGMDDYISKPFQIEVLIQKMKNLLK